MSKPAKKKLTTDDAVPVAAARNAKSGGDAPASGKAGRSAGPVGDAGDHDGARALWAGVGSRPVNWDQKLGFLMHDVSRLRRIVFDGYMKPAGVTRSQWWVLAYLSRHDGIIQTELATVLDIGKAALGGLIDRLESSGFVERRPDTDRRAKRVYLSPRGKALIREMTAKSDSMSEEILADITQEERAQLADYLTRIKARLLAIKGD